MEKSRDEILGKYAKVLERSLDDSTVEEVRKTAERKVARMEKEHPWVQKRYIVEQAVRRQMDELRERTGMPKSESLAQPRPEDSIFDFVRNKFVDITGTDPLEWGIRRMEISLRHQIRVLAEEGEAFLGDDEAIKELLMKVFATLFDELNERVGVESVAEAEDDEGLTYVVIDGMEFPESLVQRIMADPKGSEADVGRFIIGLLAGDED